MKILITGATGMVGQALVDQLLRDRHSLVALVRDEKSARKKLGPQVQLYVWDGLSGPPPAQALADVQAVVHLAGENVAGERWTKKRKQMLRDSRLLTAGHLRQGFLQTGARLKVFISASGIGYYGDRGGDLLTEADPAGRDFLAQLCVQWEAAADQMPADRIVKTRLGVVLSAGGGFLGQVVPLFKKFGASRLGSGGQWMSWVHIDDVVGVLARALTDDGLNGALNLVAPEAVTNAQMTRLVGKAVRAWPGPPAPQFALRLLYGELADALLFSQRAVPQKLKACGYGFRYGSFDEALKSLSL